MGTSPGCHRLPRLAGAPGSEVGRGPLGPETFRECASTGWWQSKPPQDQGSQVAPQADPLASWLRTWWVQIRSTASWDISLALDDNSSGISNLLGGFNPLETYVRIGWRPQNRHCWLKSLDWWLNVSMATYGPCSTAIIPNRRNIVVTHHPALDLCSDMNCEMLVYCIVWCGIA